MLPIQCSPAEAAAFTLMRRAYELERQAAELRRAAVELSQALAAAPPLAPARAICDPDPFGPSTAAGSQRAIAVATIDRPNAPAKRSGGEVAIAPRPASTRHGDPRARLA